MPDMFTNRDVVYTITHPLSLITIKYVHDKITHPLSLISLQYTVFPITHPFNSQTDPYRARWPNPYSVGLAWRDSEFGSHSSQIKDQQLMLVAF